MTFLKACLGLSFAALLAGCMTAEVPEPQVTVTRSGVAKQLFGAKQGPAALPAAPYGFYSRGCVAGARQLAETGPTWQAMRLSRNRNWAHPETIDMIETLSRRAATLPQSNGIYVGDMSQPKGGPMLTGHASHQSGLDADVWLMPATLGLDRGERERISAVSFRRARGAYVNERWGSFQHELVKAAAQDPRTDRIFIFPGAKVQMCRDATGNRDWLRKVRPWHGHHYHFHIRLRCPDGAPGCEAQDPPPPGDGCADAQAWVANILNPQPPAPSAPRTPPAPRGELQMADLPMACQAVLSR